MADLTCVWDAGAQLGEGVCWSASEQAVYWVDIIQSNLHRLGPDGAKDNWHFPGHVSAVAPCADGGLLATFKNGISHIDLNSASVTPLLALEQDLPDNRFNDGCADTLGQFWFGSMDDRQLEATGSYYCLNRDGNVDRVAAFGSACITNGPAFSTDGQWVYFTDSVERRIYRAALDRAGLAGKPALFIQLREADGHPDGMCADTDGGLWVCHFGAGRVTRFAANGAVDQTIEMPVPNITKCAFGGAKLNTLYITTAATALDEAQLSEYPLSGGLFKTELPFTGVTAPAVVRPRVKTP